jgi:photoactive yellow protein
MSLNVHIGDWKQFFSEIAPCTNVKAFHACFLAGVAKKALHAKFRYHFSFKKSPRDVSVTPKASFTSATIKHISDSFGADGGASVSFWTPRG